jgi:hydroxymethylpyrimidine/phosphomethylpyrimidine kinase
MTPIALTIAGSDASGGAGIQGDLKTFSALGVYGASIVTAITAQSTTGVHAVHAVPAAVVAAQMDAVFSDLTIGSVKIGMTWRTDVIQTIAAGLTRWRQEKVVLDPVMVASSGHALLEAEARHALVQMLFPRALVVTPNLPEAAAILDLPVARTEDEMRGQAARLLAFGPRAVLMKGGHAQGPESVDLLVETSRCTRFAGDRVKTGNTHGTGCALSSAMAAGLAKGMDLVDATRKAKSFVTRALAAADRIKIGTGVGPLHHFHATW